MTRLALPILGTFLLASLLALPTRAAELRLGLATRSLTAPAGLGLAGYYHPRGNDGVLDDLQAKAVVLDDGQTRAAVVVCDLIAMPRWMVDAARSAIQSHGGVPGSNVLVAATHTHTAPVLYREWSRDEAETAATGASASTNNAPRDYCRMVVDRIAEAVVEADSRRLPVRLLAARGSEPRLAHNRRWWMRDGTVAWNPGKLNPDLVRPAGPIDPEVGILHALTLADPARPLLTFVNYAMHPDTTGGTRQSADYPGALARALALYLGPEPLTLFANGTCGNLNHLDFRWAAPQTSPREAQRLGLILAAAVLESWPDLRPVDSPAPLQVRTAIVPAELAPFTPEQLAQARLDARTATDNTREGFMKLVRAHRILDVAAREGRPFDLEVQVITLGRQLAWVSWPGELFVELGLSVKAGSPFTHTWNVELANGTIGYIPNLSAWPEGNYEVESARVAPGTGERLATAALRLLAEAHAAAESAASRRD